MRRSFSVRAKLVGVVMFTTLVALSLAGAGLALFESRSHRRTLESELAMVAQIIGQNLPPAILMNRTDTADQALRSFDLYRDFVSVCVYTNDGTLFTSYARRPSAKDCPARPYDNQPRAPGDYLILRHEVGVGDELVATMRIVASMGELSRRMQLFALVLLGVLSASALVALLLSSGLQRVVSRPVLELASTAQNIAQSSDYTLRAPQHSRDEVGTAVAAFNQMLDRIEAAVSERKQAEEQLMALNTTLEERVAERTLAAEKKATELKRSNEELERFASVASHDLQEPLRAVSSYTQLLKERLEGKVDADLESYLVHVITGVGRMKSLINELLGYARVGRTMARTHVETEKTLDSAIADLSTALAESGAEVVRGKMPKVWANPVQLCQVFSNLISNAIRFRGATPLRISIWGEEKGDFCRFAVRDNGIGIDSRHHERIFIIFQRLHGRDRPGTGMGLAICRKIVELHQGRIWVESAVGEGATFFFDLPTSGS
jgi:signal transduction histidine kinase